VWDILKEKKPDLYKKIWDWTLENKPNPKKRDLEVFGKNSKHAIKVFFDELNNLDKEIVDIIEKKAYEDALKFFDAFNAKGTGKIVREYKG
jgi:fructose-bisphosphate aldolase class II